VPSDPSDLHGTQAGARQVVEVTTNAGEALGGCFSSRLPESARPQSCFRLLHPHAAITIAHPTPVALGNRPENSAGREQERLKPINLAGG
jgi:hypothetical protein